MHKTPPGDVRPPTCFSLIYPKNGTFAIRHLELQLPTTMLSSMEGFYVVVAAALSSL